MLLLVLLVPGAVGLAQAQSTAAEQVERARVEQSLMGSIMSPFCPGKTIDSCPSPRAEVWRHDIRQWVSEGESGEQIRARLQARTPNFDISGRPGVTWDWALPVAAMALATLWLASRVRRDKGTPPPSATSETKRDALDERLDRELSQADL